MAEQKNPQAQPELSLSEQTRIRREKLTNLQAEGQNPFVITRFDWDAHLPADQGQLRCHGGQARQGGRPPDEQARHG